MFSFMGIFVLGGLGWGMFLTLRATQKNHKARWIILLVLMPVMLWFFMRFSYQRSMVHNSSVNNLLYHQHMLRTDLLQEESLPDIWLPGGLADQRPIDVYVSPQAAANGLALELSGLLPRLMVGNVAGTIPTPSEQPSETMVSDMIAPPALPAEAVEILPPIIQIYSNSSRDVVPLDVPHVLSEAIRKRYKQQIQVLVEAAPPANPIRKNNQQALEVQITGSLEQHSTRSNQVIARSGVIVFNLSGPAGSLSRSYPYNEQNWLNDFVRYTSLPGNESLCFVLGRSSEVCGSKEEAEHQALDRAARKIIRTCVPLLSQVVTDNRTYAQVEEFSLNGGDRIDLPPGYQQPELDRLVAELNSRGAVREKYAQRIQGEAGDIWRAAVLVQPEAYSLQEFFTRQSNHGMMPPVVPGYGSSSGITYVPQSGEIPSGGPDRINMPPSNFTYGSDITYNGVSYSPISTRSNASSRNSIGIYLGLLAVILVTGGVIKRITYKS